MSYHNKGYYEEEDLGPPGEHFSSREHHREYEREWDRGKEAWDWERDHPRRRSRSRSRSRDRRSRREKKKRDWSSDSEASRSRSRSRERRYRSRSRSREHFRKEREHPSYDDYREREPEKNETWKSSAPNCTIMVSNLPLHITENEIRANITAHGIVPKDIRLIRRKDTGTSRGFAFVEFIRLPEAVRWMENNQGCLLLENQYQATLQYSISKDSYNEKVAKAPQDWFCIHCGEHNFKRREICFKCQAPRSEAEMIDDVQKEISPFPTSTVLLRNLDALTTEDRVLSVLQNVPGVATLPIKSVRVGRDPLSNVSRGVCYLDMNNTGDSMRLFAGLCEAGSLEIDGREIAISYCKQANATMSTSAMATAATNASTPVGATAVAAAQWSVSNARNKPQAAASSGEVNFTAEEIPRMAEYSASLYAKTPEERVSYLEYYKKYYTDQLRAASSKKQASSAPDLSKYVYDEQSGYYYDTSTNLYYDAKTQYFYNPLTQQFSYWDNDSNCFVPVASNDPSANAQASAEQKDEKKEKPEKQDKVTVAKKIAKDMEKWAKTLNQKKETSKVAAPAPLFEPPVERRKEPEPIAEKDSLNEVLQVFHRKQLAEKKALAAPAFATHGSDSDGEGLDDKKLAELLEGLVDWTKLACLLCKRQFNNRDTLVKHQQMSDLHKQNLEAWKKQHTPMTYRDRAKERRMKHGEDSPPRTKQDFSARSRPEVQPTSYEQPSPSGMASNNVGSKLLQKMGWQEGQGLGKSNQGRTTIIETERRSAQAGLGMKTYGVAGDDYRANVRKMAMMRFKELSEQDNN